MIGATDLIHPTVAPVLPIGDDWVYELKYDGFRCLALKMGCHVRLLSRQGRDMAASFPDVAADLKKLRGNVAIDGELVVADAKGRPNFGCLARRGLMTRPLAVQAAMKHSPAVLFAFDALWCGGKDQRRRTLLERKDTLQNLLTRSRRILYTKHVEDGKEAFAFAVLNELEGIVAKHITSVYRAGRSGKWWKMKTPAGIERERGRLTRLRR